MSGLEGENRIRSWVGVIEVCRRNISTGSEWDWNKTGAGDVRRLPAHESTEETANINLDLESESPVEPWRELVGMATVSGKRSYIHTNQSYCEECRGSPSRSEAFGPVTVPATLSSIDPENSIRLAFREVPDSHRGLIGADIDMGINSKDAGKVLVQQVIGNLDPDSDEVRVTGELHRVEELRKKVPQDVRFGDRMETDRKTHLVCAVQDVGTISIKGNTKVVFKSPTVLEVVRGKVNAVFESLKKNDKFSLETQYSVCTVRGTDLTVEVRDDGTTVLSVHEGEAEFSDLGRKRTVKVAKHEQSVCKPGDLPSDPVPVPSRPSLGQPFAGPGPFVGMAEGLQMSAGRFPGGPGPGASGDGSMELISSELEAIQKQIEELTRLRGAGKISDQEFLKQHSPLAERMGALGVAMMSKATASLKPCPSCGGMTGGIVPCPFCGSKLR